MNFTGFQLERAIFLRWYRSLLFASLRLLALLVIILALLVLVLDLLVVNSPTLTGFALILLGPALLVGSFHLYVTYVREHPEYLISPRAKQAAPLNNFDYVGALALQALGRKKSWSGFWHHLFSLVPLANVFYRLGLTEETLGTLFADAKTEGEAETLIQRSLERSSQSGLVDGFELARIALLHPTLKTFLESQKLDLESVDGLISFYQGKYQLVRQSHFWLPENQGHSGGVGKLWAVGYTNLLDQFTQELTPEIRVREKFRPLYGRDNLAAQVVTELNKTQGQNVLLVGPSGVGKHELFFTVASRILNFQTKTPLDGMQVRLLNLQSVLAAAPTPAELPQLFQALFADLVHAGNVLLFIPDIDLLMRVREPAPPTRPIS